MTPFSIQLNSTIKSTNKIFQHQQNIQLNLKVVLLLTDKYQICFKIYQQTIFL